MTTDLFRLKLCRLGFNYYQTDHQIAVFRPELGVLVILNLTTHKMDYPSLLMPPGAVIQLLYQYMRALKHAASA